MAGYRFSINLNAVLGRVSQRTQLGDNLVVHTNLTLLNPSFRFPAGSETSISNNFL
jgi:hypothetical protein